MNQESTPDLSEKIWFYLAVRPTKLVKSIIKTEDPAEYDFYVSLFKFRSPASFEFFYWFGFSIVPFVKNIQLKGVQDRVVLPVNPTSKAAIINKFKTLRDTFICPELDVIDLGGKEMTASEMIAITDKWVADSTKEPE